MLKVCQQHLLSQVDTAATQSGGKQASARERVKGRKGQYARQEKRDIICRPSQKTVKSNPDR